MKKNLFCMWLGFLAILFSVTMQAQMTIGGKKAPESFSALEVLNIGGVRLPQMTTAQRNAFAVQGNVKGEGLTIYNIDTKCVEYWNKTRWISMCDDVTNGLLATADNGLTVTGGKVQLGGALIKPSVLTTTSAYTLAIQGLQTGSTVDKILVADANGILKWIDRSTLGGDNLGNHTATTNLEMSDKHINNVNNANIKLANISYGVSVKDRIVTNANDFVLYKSGGILGLYNSGKSGNDLTIDEVTRKTGVNNLSINRGTDGLVPAAGYVATSADVSGNVVWKDPKTVAGLTGATGATGPAGAAGAKGDKGDTGAQGVIGLTGPAGAAGAKGDKGDTGAQGVIGLTGPAGAAGAKGDKGDTGAAGIGGKTTAGTNVTVTGAGTDVSPYVVNAIATGDNLGNHTATTTLNMSKNTINNINTAYFVDQIASNVNNYGFYKNNGILGLYNSLKSGNDLSINEATRRTTVNNLAIATSTDGAAPVSGYVATSADASGNVIWKDPKTVAGLTGATGPAGAAGIGGKTTSGVNTTVTGAGTDASPYVINATGDNLGNHTATTTLNMASNNISNINNAYIKNEAQILDRTTANTNYFGLYKSNGTFGVYNSLRGGNALSINESTSNVGIGTNSPSNTLHVSGVNPIRVEGLVNSTSYSDSGLVVDANGVVKKALTEAVKTIKYDLTLLAPNESRNLTLGIIGNACTFIVSLGNACGYTQLAQFTSVGDYLVYTGGGGVSAYTTVSSSNGYYTDYVLSMSTGGCGDGSTGNWAGFKIAKRGTTLTITNNGNIKMSYQIIQTVL